ncbi:hypothetical protein jhhlp_001959 [Lomentospora prolificans]|uniref:Guanine nucleotide-exchange factor SEC12 n=1 Tax=Lomentospora prolificans TaxID=41688 RepID=A0A2N3NCQ7_9PEZI|nr:hypothetical protein jhhlp_001959 [Lomentospora prolificans]
MEDVQHDNIEEPKLKQREITTKTHSSRKRSQLLILTSRGRRDPSVYNKMAPPDFPSAKLTLSYPLYACDFDPQDPTRLVVGGGGGPGRSGVGNKITVINANDKSDLTVAGEADLSRDEDSVSSLAVGPRKGKSVLVYAGINSSPAEVQKGKNEHLRTFAVEGTKTRAAGSTVPSANVAEVSRTALFSATHPEEYQRVLRLGGASSSGTQLGAAASGLGKDFEIALFEVSPTGPPAPKSKGKLELKKQADDIDIIQTGEDSYQIAYCHEYEIYTVDVTKGVAGDSRLVFTTPHNTGTGVQRAQFRSIRYLTPNFILAVANLPKRTGVLLQGIRLPSKVSDNGRVAIVTKLPKNVAQATALAVQNLTPPASPGAQIGRVQFLIAVAGHDSSISLYTLEHKFIETISVLYELFPLRTLKEVHPLQITGLAFSTYTAPKAATTRPQAVKLASISMANTVVVHAIPLKKFVDKSVPTRRGGPPRPVRYVVAAKSTNPATKPFLITLSIVVLILAIICQGFLELIGSSPPILGAAKFISPYGTLRNPQDDFINRVLGGLPRATQQLVLREEPVLPGDEAEVPPQIQVGVDYDETEGKATSWEELTAKQKKLWKEKLREQGYWAEKMGEDVFKGVLFGQIAGAVGQAIGG